MKILSKKNLIIIVIVLLISGIVGYLWITRQNADKTSNVNKADEASADLQAIESNGVVVTTDKVVYKRGENIKFVITNNTRGAIWYIVPTSKCGKSFYGQMSRRGVNHVWDDGIIVWLSCGDKNAGVDSLKISKLEPGKSMEELWNQDVAYYWAGDNGVSAVDATEKMFPGIYRFGFPYAEKEIFLKDISSLEIVEEMNFLPNQAFSADFEIKDDGTIDLASKKARDAMRKSNLSYIYSRLISYFDDHNDMYPISGNMMVKFNDRNSTVYKELVPKYVDADFMKDPKDPDSYFGYKSLDGKGFELTAVLENSEDKDCVIKNNLCIYKLSLSGEYFVQ